MKEARVYWDYNN